MTRRGGHASAALHAGQSVEMEAFEPHALLRGFHRMTIAAMFIRADLDDPLPRVEERVFDVDGDTQVLALCSWQAEPSPVLVLIHGFAGHADRPYMRGITRKAFAAGFHVVRLNIRNCGGTEHLAGSLYHAGLVSDLAAVTATLQGDARCRGIHLAGYSMGGNVVLRLGGLWGGASPSSVASIVAVSPVIDLEHCATNLDRRWNLRVYRNSFLNGLRSVYQRRAELYPDRYDVGRIAGIRTLRSFDERMTAPDCGFAGVDEYYRAASSRWELPNLRIPSLVLHARDDLLVPFPAEQLQALEEAPAVHLLMSPHGGHCGFVGRRVPEADADRYWAENRLVQFIQRMEGHRRSGDELEAGASSHQD